eukprot:3017305-Amphidinium_carterae.2
MMSGRSIIVPSRRAVTARDILGRCAQRLGLSGYGGRPVLVHGAEVVDSTEAVTRWPGIKRDTGEVSEYMLVVKH